MHVGRMGGAMVGATRVGWYMALSGVGVVSVGGSGSGSGKEGGAKRVNTITARA